MILDNKLRNLKVGVKVGGSLVSHRVVFSPNEKLAFVISGCTVHVYSTRTGLHVGETKSPNVDPIANISFEPPSSSLEGKSQILTILTTTGLLGQVDCSTDEYNLLSIQNVNAFMPKNWAKISEWLDMQCIQPNKFLMVGRVESVDEEVMLYHVHRSTEENQLRYHFEFDKICWQVRPTTHSVCWGARGHLIGAIQEDSLCVIDYTQPTTPETRWHKSGTRMFTCVAAHPTSMIVATGDDSGRIVIWNNILERSPSKTVFHWHTLPVADLRFSAGGSEILSGGGECTLVNWNEQNSQDRKLLPRMGLPIRHISVSSENSYIAVSHADNCIQLVDRSFTVTTTIQNITQCYIPEDSKQSISDSSSSAAYFRAGLHLDPRTNCLVMNGRPGHLQCYSFREDKHLYSLHITQQNYVTDERKKIVRNTDVTHVTFSNRGKWLVTAEALFVKDADGKDNCSEVRLKFWEFDKVKQSFVLNTSIDWPHEKELECVRIQETDDEDLSLMAATSGKDRRFKTWGLVSDRSTLHDKSYWWNCENAGSYRDLNTGPLTFSRDGSVLAVVFGHAVCLWTCDNHEFKGSMSHTRLQEDIRMIEFGCHMSSHLIVCCSSKNIIVWDVITLMLTWTVPFEAEILVVDPLTNTAAVFSSENHVYFFHPEKPQPVAIHKNISRSPVVSAVFVPNPTTQNQLNTLKSSLVFLNSSQELCVFLSKDSAKSNQSDVKPKVRDVDEFSTLTPFIQLIPERRISEVKPKQESEFSSSQSAYFGQGSAQVIREILDSSPHTMPSVTFFCDKLLSSVSIPRDTSSETLEMAEYVKDSFKNKAAVKVKTSGASMVDESDDESDGEEEPKKKHEQMPSAIKTEHKVIKEEAMDVVVEEKYDYQYDLESVATGNIEWIESIFSS